MENKDSNNTLFDKALSFVNQTNLSLFLTGKAGTGKTTFLRYIKANCYKKMAVVAPTGVAAINAGGVTIHSFFQLPFGSYVPTHKTIWGGEFQNIYNKNQLLGNLRLNSTKRAILRELDLLIIDEISMVRADVMDAIDAVLRSVRRRQQEPFGGVQLLLIGDMFQLPPVVREAEWEHLSAFYNSPYFFDAMAIQEVSPIYIELKKIYRQSDETFIRILNHVRNNICTQEDLDILNDYYHPYFVPSNGEGYITLTSHNSIADNINQQALERLNGKSYKIEATVSKEFPEHAYPVEKTLFLKEGAQIMFVKNDKGENRKFYNGKIGVIERIDIHDDKIWIAFPNEKDLLQLELETWRNIRYNYDNENDEINEEELGTFSQYPIRLAWAITIHKSQGLTFEKAIIDAGQSFAPGQVYVALSRLTGMEGLVLKSKITTSGIMTDERIIAFTKQEVNEDHMQQMLANAQMIFAEQSLIEAFSWEKLTENWQNHTDDIRAKNIADKEEIMAFSQQVLFALQQQLSTAQKFKGVLHNYLQQGKSQYLTMYERTKAAAEWFENGLKTQVLQPLKNHFEASKGKKRTKKYLADLKEIIIEAERKSIQVAQTIPITEGLATELSHDELMQRVSLLHSPIAVSETVADIAMPAKKVVGETKRTSLEMYKQGKSIAEIAKERNLALSTIEGHLADFVTTGEIQITELVPANKLAAIMYALQQNPEATSSIIREQVGNDYSYGEIKAAISFWKMENSTKESAKND